jgi:hypothetical protein
MTKRIVAEMPCLAFTGSEVITEAKSQLLA